MPPSVTSQWHSLSVAPLVVVPVEVVDVLPVDVVDVLPVDVVDVLPVDVVPWPQFGSPPGLCDVGGQALPVAPPVA